MSSPSELLAQARSTLAGSVAWGGAWPRAAAFLGRQALESAVEAVWSAPVAGLAACSMTTQLVCLPYYLDDPAAGYRVRQCWHLLSAACHAHPYELAPTVGELRGLLDEVGAFVAATAAANRPRQPVGFGSA